VYTSGHQEAAGLLSPNDLHATHSTMRRLWDVVSSRVDTEYVSGHGGTMIVDMDGHTTHTHHPYVRVTGEQLLEREVDP